MEKGIFSEQTAHPLWKAVRKGVAPAFMPLNLRCCPAALHAAWCLASCLPVLRCPGHACMHENPLICLPRNYHPEVVAVINRLIDGIKSKGPGEVIDISNVAQARQHMLVKPTLA